MEATVQSGAGLRDEVDLFPAWRSREAAARALWARLASAALHVLAVCLLAFTPLGSRTVHNVAGALIELREPFHLVAPPPELTQTAPNRGRVGKEFDLESLLPRPRVFTPPPGAPGAPPAPRHVPVLPEPPPIEVAIAGVMPFGQAAEGLRLPPPQIQTEETPKLTAPSPGTQRGVGVVKPPVGAPAPGARVSELARDLARGRGSGPLIVEDFGPASSGLESGFPLEPSAGRTGSSLELLSDPRGVDFKPYLVRILASVKRNWMAVIPESAKLGRRGRVALQFIINKDGSVPRLVIASPSGTDALDRAAVAGISATNPFPPLPSEFRGDSIRLQFVFSYNMPR
ncbi:MAG: TonB family protein [Bryobacterales bacterium]|nr:TonB family protein [Bryobacterales bacterium]